MRKTTTTLFCLAAGVAACAPASRMTPASAPARTTLTVAARVEHLDTLTREPMLLEHPSGALFVAGYNRRRPGLWKSLDRGATWARLNVGDSTQGAIGNSDVDLAVAPDGTVYFVSMGFNNAIGEGTHVAVGVSRDVGTTWRWTTVSRARFDDRPWIVVAPDGVAHIIWNDGRGVNHSVSRDGGLTWVRMARVHDRGGSSHLAVGPRGELAVRVTPGAASGNTCDEGVDLVTVSTDAGVTWRASPAPGGLRPSGCSDDSRALPRWVDPLAWDATGALYALWTDTTGVRLARSANQGATWTIWQLATEPMAYFPYLVARGPGELAATWVTDTGDNLRWHVVRIDAHHNGAPPDVRRSTPMTLESWRGDPPRADAGGEYLALAFLRDGSLGVVTTIQHDSADRLGFTWWRFAVP